MQRGVLMLQNIWYILRRKTMPVLILISGSQRCLPICADLPSSMHWGQYPLIKHGWIYGKRQTERAGNQSLYMKITPCRSSTVMSCIVKARKGKTKHTWNSMTVMTGNGPVYVWIIRIWNIWENAGQGKRHLPRLWKRDTRSIFCVFPIKRK